MCECYNLDTLVYDYERKHNVVVNETFMLRTKWGNYGYVYNSLPASLLTTPGFIVIVAAFFPVDFGVGVAVVEVEAEGGVAVAVVVGGVDGVVVEVVEDVVVDVVVVVVDVVFSIASMYFNIKPRAT